VEGGFEGQSLKAAMLFEYLPSLMQDPPVVHNLRKMPPLTHDAISMDSLNLHVNTRFPQPFASKPPIHIVAANPHPQLQASAPSVPNPKMKNLHPILRKIHNGEIVLEKLPHLPWLLPPLLFPRSNNQGRAFFLIILHADHILHCPRCRVI